MRAFRLIALLMVFPILPFSQAQQERPRSTMTVTDGEVVRPVSEVTTQALEDPGIIRVTDGETCGQSNQSGRERPVVLQGSSRLPSYATDATVFLNGWRVEYLSGDHHIGRVYAVIGNVEQEGNRLTWDATGILRDKNFDDGFRFCYTFTVVAWNRARIDARVLGFKDVDTFSSFERDEHVALVTAAGYFRDRTLVEGQRAVVLPLGFTFGWEEGFSQADHHIFNMAYHLGPSALYAQAGRDWDGPPPPITEDQATGYVSWESYGIFKDKQAKRDFYFGNRLGVLAGASVGAIHPPFSIIPHEDRSNCGAFGGGVHTEQRVVRNVPFDYAIPVLTGWEMYWHCDDEHLREAGVWLHDVSYERAPEATTGTLRYSISSIMRDKDNVPLHEPHYNVSILGLYTTTRVGRATASPRLDQSRSSVQ